MARATRAPAARRPDTVIANGGIASAAPEGAAKPATSEAAGAVLSAAADTTIDGAGADIPACRHALTRSVQVGMGFARVCDDCKARVR